MALINLTDIGVNFTGTMVLDGISLQIEAGERVCLLGRNGEGKSTLLSVIDGTLEPDNGTVDYAKGTRVAMLPQQVPQDVAGLVYDVAAQGLGEAGAMLSDYHRITRLLDTAEGKEHDKALKQLEKAQSILDETGGWPHHQAIETVLSHLKLNADDEFKSLSGGTKRRALLARALVSEPNLLILDEPTNHLDIDSITWLEDFLLRRVTTLLFVTHDRAFLRRLATRIVELDRGRLYSWHCDYPTYLERKEAELEAEEKQNRNFDKKLAQEEVWIRQGIKARRTRNMGRVRQLVQLREERKARRDRTGQVSMVIQDAVPTGKLVVEAADLRFSYDGKTILNGFSTSIMRGDRVGLIGPNGAGKTTLLKLLLGEIPPQQGTIRHGVNLQISYFDQLREQLDNDKTARQNVADGNDFVDINGRRRHVMGYLKDFLFTPDRAQVPAHVLSGGERNRLLLARLFTRPSNVLVLDEPTNDLDAETLDLLEELLMDYPGTLLLVSHDRAFLNNVVTSTIAFEPEGRVAEYVGGYDDWLRQRPDPAQQKKTKAKLTAAAPARRKLSFKEKFRLDQEKTELAEMPARIESLETVINRLHKRMADPDYYKAAPDEISRDKDDLERSEAELETVFIRWEELEASVAELSQFVD